MVNIDIKGQPFNLSDEDLQWVESTLASMSVEEKIGQLFFPLELSKKHRDIDRLFNTIQPGGMMCRPFGQKDIMRLHQYLQDKSKIPMFLSEDLESGGHALVEEGTKFGNNMLVAATNDSLHAKRLGMVCAREAAAVGGNMAFAPVIDINYNFHNAITNIRSFGDDPEKVAEMGIAYMQGVQSENSMVTIKHFPGDGCDGRNQHLCTTVNSLSVERWRASYGKVYEKAIRAGARGLMVGHIAFPAYIRERHPDGSVDPMTPGSLSVDLLQGLLRGELGYRGLIMTDATLMVGFCQTAPRSELVPRAIAVGNDMFLFNKNYEEDYQYMMEGYKRGIISEERLEEACLRILAAKASMKLHKRKSLVPGHFHAIATPEHREWAREAADCSVTLVRDTGSILPLNPGKMRKVAVFSLGREKTIQDMLGNVPGFKGLLVKAAARLFGKKKQSVHEYFIEQLHHEGFDVTVLDHSNPFIMMKSFQESIAQFKERFDMVIYLVTVMPMPDAMSLHVPFASLAGSDAPWFVNELPTLAISFGNPYHDYDLGMIPTFINAYMGSIPVANAVIEKIMGRSNFKGVSPVDLSLKEFVPNAR